MRASVCAASPRWLLVAGGACAAAVHHRRLDDVDRAVGPVQAPAADLREEDRASRCASSRSAPARRSTSARRGDADVVFVHAKAAEEKFARRGQRRQALPGDVQRLRADRPESRPGASRRRQGHHRGAEEDRRRRRRRSSRAATRAARTSRSSTCGRRPASTSRQAKGPWYRDTGQGMGPALNTASAMNAYILPIAAPGSRSRIAATSTILVEGDKRLFNQYGVMLVNPEKHPQREEGPRPGVHRLAVSPRRPEGDRRATRSTASSCSSPTPDPTREHPSLDGGSRRVAVSAAGPPQCANPPPGGQRSGASRERGGIIQARRPSCARRLRRRTAPGSSCSARAIALVALALVALGSGRYPLSAAEVGAVVWNGLTGSGDAGMADAVVWQIRLPRVGVAMLVGAALSAAGTAYQHLFRNPLVAPDTLGVSSGAALGAVLGIFFGAGFLAIEAAAFIGGLGGRGPGDAHRVAAARARVAGHADPDGYRRREPAGRGDIAAQVSCRSLQRACRRSRSG